MSSSKIIILDEATINKIAAGEVVERPASVVKELIENSIDAGSTKIMINVKDGGMKLIQVSDNGSGMSPEDADLAFLRHTTSKIKDADDLFKIHTLGFRGEALASIAAVSRAELITRTKTSLTGTKVVVEGGKIIETSETSCPEGTTVVVRDLFFNTPARRKFLKNTKIELGHIIDIVRRYALIYFNISFSLTSDEKNIFKTPMTNNMLENIAYVFGKEIAKEMIPVEFSNKFEIGGYISKPSTTRANRNHQYLYVNKRYTTNISISKAIEEAYGTLLMKNRHPIFVLNLKIDPKSIDVNVHPTKREIRFSLERTVLEAFTTAIKSAFKALEPILTIEMKDEVTEELIEKQQLKLKESSVPEQQVLQEKVQEPITTSDTVIPSLEIHQIEKLKPVPPIELKDEKMDITIIGQLHNSYIIAQDQEGLLIVDQHAADERICFENLLDSFNQSKLYSQDLISPIVIQLTPKERHLIINKLDLLNELQIKIEHFGKNSFIIRGLPVTLGKISDKSDVIDLIDDLVNSEELRVENPSKEEIIKLIACHSAIRAGEPLSPKRMIALIKNLNKTKLPFTCPHGRPTIIRIPIKQLEKKFKRT